MSAAAAPRAFHRLTSEGIELSVRVTPKSSKDAIEGVGETAQGHRHLRVRVRASPQDGKANQALEKLLAEWLDVAPRDVAVKAGAASRLKRVMVGGEPQALAARLKTVIDSR